MSTVVPMNEICGGTGGCEAVICAAVISVLGFHQLGSLGIGDILLFLPLCTPVLKPNLNLKNKLKQLFYKIRMQQTINFNKLQNGEKFWC